MAENLDYTNTVNDMREELNSTEQNEFDTIAKDLNNEGINNAAFVAQDKDPARQAKVITLAEQFGAKNDFVDENFNEIIKSQENYQLKKKLIDNQQQAPKTVNFLKNPDNLSVSKNDIDNLIQIEKSVDSYSYINQAYNSLMSGLAQGYSSLAKTPAFIGNVLLMPGNLIRKTIGLEQVGYSYENPVSQYYEKAKESFSIKAPEAQESIIKQAMDGDLIGAGRTLGLQFLANFPNQVAIWSSVLAGNPMVGLGYAGLTTSSDKASELSKQGIMNFDATAIAAAHGAIEVGLEELGTVSIIKNMQNALAKNFSKQTAREVIFNSAKTIVANSFQEGSEEFTTSLAQDLTDYLTGINPDAMKGSIIRALDAAAVGALSGGIPTGIATGFAGIEKRNQIKNAQRAKDFFTALSEQTQNSELRKNLPKKYQDLLTELTKETIVENVYISTEGFQTLFQTNDLSPAQIAQELGIAEAFDKAIETGNDIELKTSEFATKIAGTTYYQDIANHIKFNPNDLTQSEATLADEETKIELQRLYEKAIADKTPDIIEANDKSASEVGDDITNQLIQNHAYTPKAARQIGLLWKEFFKTMGLKSGIDPVVLYKKYGVKINNMQFSDFTELNPEAIPVDEIGNEYIPQETIKELESNFSYINHGNVHSLIKLNSEGTINFNFDNNMLNIKDISVPDLATLSSFVKASNQIAEKLRMPINLSTDAIGKLKNLPEDLIENVLIKDGYSFTKNEDGSITVHKALTLFQNIPVKLEERILTPLGFYSKVYEEINKMDFKTIPPQDLMNRIKNIQGVKKEELEALNIFKYLESYEGKISKDDILKYVNDNSIKLKQTVLGTLEKDIPTSFDFSDTIYVPLSEYDRYHYNDLVSEMVYEDLRDKYVMKEYIELYRPQYIDEFTDEDGNIDEEGLLKKIEDITSESLQEHYEEYVDSEDSHYGYYKIEEQNSGYYIEGNPEYGNFDIYDDRGRHVSDIQSNNVDEAKIQFGQFLIDEGIIEEDIRSLITEKDIEWSSLRNKAKYSITRKANQILKTDKERLRAVVRYEIGFQDEETENRDIERQANFEANQYYNNPDVIKNSIITTITTHGIKGELIGNNIKGWKFTAKVGKKYNTVKLTNKNIEEAKKEAIGKLYDWDILIKPKISNNPIELNLPTDQQKYKTYALKDAKNYREFLLRLDENLPENFIEGSHFTKYPNIITFVRTSDRIDQDNKKVLFIEELQSDWAQQGREYGFANLEDAARKETLNKQLDQLQTEYAQTHKEFRKQARSFPLLDIYKAEIEDIENQNAILENANAIELKPLLEILNKNSDDQKIVKRELSEINDKVPQMPMANTEAWTSLAMKRMLNVAVEEGYDSIAWTPSEVHIDRWGSDKISWIKKEGETRNLKIVVNKKQYGTVFQVWVLTETGDEELLRNFKKEKDAQEYIQGIKNPHWLVGAIEQSGGNVDNINIEEQARQRGILLEKEGQIVTTKTDLIEIAKEILSRDHGQRSLNSIIDQVWELMQNEKSGIKKPRADGMRFFYDFLLPKKIFPNVLKAIDKDIKIIKKEINIEDEKLETLGFDISDKAKDMVKKGQTFYQEQMKGAITFGSNRQFTISLFENKDESTFLHESAHFFFEVMGDLAELPNAPKDLVADYQIILNWMGAKSRQDVTTDMHETLARGFEQYLMEGKAPSDILRKAFTTFKNWMLLIYKEVTNLNVQISDEIRGVFDRILASERIIEQAEKKLGPRFLFENLINTGMNYNTSVEYLKALDDARDIAKDEIRAKLIKDLMRKKDADFKETYDLLYAEELDKAKKLKPFIAIQQLKTELKLSKQVVEREYSAFKDYLPKGSTIIEGGFHPDTVALIFGYENGEAMIKDIAQHRRGIENYVEREVATLMKERFPDLLDSPELTDEAIRAYHNEKAAEVKKLEMKILIRDNPNLPTKIAKALIKRIPTDKEVKKQAERIIAKTQVKEVKPHIFRNYERKYAKLSSQAFGKGDYELAFDSKRKEYLNFELYRAAMQAKDEYKKGTEFFKKVYQADADIAKTRDIDLINAARSVLAKFGVGQTDKTPDDYLSMMKEYDPETYAILSNLINENTKNAQELTEINFEDFINLKDTVQTLWDLSRSTREIELENEKRDINQLADELTFKLKSHQKDIQDAYTKEITRFGRIHHGLLGIKAELTRIEQWTKALDLGSQGKFWKYIYRPVSDAVVKYKLKRIDILTQYQSILDNYKDNLTYDKIVSDELKHIFANKAELIMAILHTGNNSNKEKLLVGRNWGEIDDEGNLDSSRWDNFIDRLQKENILTKQDYDFAQNIWNLLESLKPEAQKVHKQLYGFYFNEITANPINTPWGVYSGGYIPAKADIYKSPNDKINHEREIFEKNNNNWQFPTTGKGFTKSRIEQYRVPLSLDMNLLNSHIDSVLRFTYIQPTARQIGRLVLNKNFKTNLDAIAPQVANEALIPWLQRSAQQQVILPSTTPIGKYLGNVFHYIRANTAMQIMFGSLSNAMQQFTGLIITNYKVKGKYLRNASYNYVMNHKQFINSIMEKSDWMKVNQGANVYELHNAIKEIIVDPNIVDDIQTFFKKHVYFLQSATQNIVNNIAWYGAYEQAIANGLGENDAIKEADSIVRTTQGTTNPEDISRWETGSKVELVFKQFVSYFNMLANFNASELYTIQKTMGLRKGAGRAFYLYLMGFSLPAFISSMIMSIMGGRIDEDDDDQYLDDILKAFFGSQVTTALSTIPIVGNYGQAFYNVLFGDDKPYNARLNVAPVISIMERNVKAVDAIYDIMADEKQLTKTEVKDILQLLGVMSGIPLGPVAKPITYMMQVESGAIQPEGPIDFARGLITGKSGE